MSKPIIQAVTPHCAVTQKHLIVQALFLGEYQATAHFHVIFDHDSKFINLDEGVLEKVVKGEEVMPKYLLGLAGFGLLDDIRESLIIESGWDKPENQSPDMPKPKQQDPTDALEEMLGSIFGGRAKIQRAGSLSEILDMMNSNIFRTN